MKVSSAQYVTSAVDLHGLPNSLLPEVCFAGRSNVGKSSLINCLAGVRSLSYTSSTPGRTRCLNFYLINSSFHFVDLPGYGYAKVSQEMRSSFRTMVESYFSSRRQLRGVLMIIDGRHLPMPSDLALKDWLIHRKLPYQAVLTKMDKVSRGEWRETQRRAAGLLGCAGENALLFSAVSGWGKERIWNVIEGMLQEVRTNGEDAVHRANRSGDSSR